MDKNLIVILGPTASGKTRLAALLAHDREGEIISADSRQVYRGLDIGTGKDYDDYTVDGKKIPYHLIDIVDPAYEFSVFDYQEHFFICFSEILERGNLPVLVGGTGLYLDAILRNYTLKKVPIDPNLRMLLQSEDESSLVKKLEGLNPNLHNSTDRIERERIVRAIEIAQNSNTMHHEEGASDNQDMRPLVIGLRWERSILRQRITKRLEERLAAGLLDEIRTLHDKGICSWEKMNYFGLEYRYISLYLQGVINYADMFAQLNTKIHQFAKRQETWFRRMEKKGIKIHWLDGADYSNLKSLLNQVDV